KEQRLTIGRSYDIRHIIRSSDVKMKYRALTSAQIRAARAMIRWRAEDLARQSAVGVATIRRAELADGTTSMTAANDLAILRALENAGIEFLDENGGGPGVRFQKRTQSKRSSR